jgi:hypothetical protein
LGAMYGEGVKDRLKEMFNFFWWGGQSKRWNRPKHQFIAAVNHDPDVIKK